MKMSLSPMFPVVSDLTITIKNEKIFVGFANHEDGFQNLVEVQMGQPEFGICKANNHMPELSFELRLDLVRGQGWVPVLTVTSRNSKQVFYVPSGNESCHELSTLL